MTSTRVMRATKAKIFLYVCVVLLITGLIACFNNALSQLDDVKKSNEICHQQEENLSTQLQVISDYKQRIEKSLKTEKAEHQQTKTNSENKLNDEKNKHEKLANEASLKFNSLQQHFNLLQTQHEDFKEECSKEQEKQLNEINDLKAKLKEVQEQLKKIDAVRESLKSQNLELLSIKDTLEKQVKGNSNMKGENESKMNHLEKINHQLQREVDSLKEKCVSSYDRIHEPPQNNDNNNEVVNSPSPAVKSLIHQNQDQNVLAVPGAGNDQKSSTKSTTAASNLRVSKGMLNGARPLLVPTVTPETIIKNKVVLQPPGNSDKIKVPEGVVPIRENDQHEAANNEIINNRYQNKIDKNLLKDDENGAHEVFDVPGRGGGADGLVFGDKKETKVEEGPQMKKQHIDTMGVGDKKNYEQAAEGDYKEIANEAQMEENEPDEDDDVDEYGEHLGRQKDPAVRN